MTVPSESGCSVEILRESLISIAVEQWRFSRVFERILGKLDAGEHRRYESQYSWFTKKVAEAMEKTGLRLVNIEGQFFEPGIAATPMNIDEFGEEDVLVIDKMIEPIVMGTNGIIRRGTVTLRKVEK